MRMWMTDPATMCRKHLLGEHGEIHKHRHNFVRGHSIAGRRGQIEPLAMGTRHDALACEMVRRGYRHASPYAMPDLTGYGDLTSWLVDVEQSERDLANRCEECQKNGRTK